MLTLTAEEARRVLEAAVGDRLEALYVLALSTGMRQGELLALRWKDVSLERGTLQVRATLQPTKDGLRISDPKTKASRRSVQLTPTAIETLRRHRIAQNEGIIRIGHINKLQITTANASAGDFERERRAGGAIVRRDAVV